MSEVKGFRCKMNYKKECVDRYVAKLKHSISWTERVVIKRQQDIERFKERLKRYKTRLAQLKRELKKYEKT